MKITGLIAEYNPLHNGHIHHLNTIMEQNPDLIIGVISSSMTMRGDLSIFDKFTKTKQALEAGIDIVVELPMAYAMQRADIFASHAVELLSSLGVQEIVFGSEENNLKLYEKIYTKKEFSQAKDISMKQDAIALKALGPNDTLGYFYYSAVRERNYPIQLTPIQRIKSQYHEKELTDEAIASATAIRNHIEKIEEYTPSFVSMDKDKLLDEEKLFPYIKYRILSMSEEELRDIFFVDEGIEYKLKDIKDYTTFDSFITYLSGKKYTKTRMKRMLMYILYNIRKEEMNVIESGTIRILGYSKKGKDYLSSIKHDVSFYTNIKNGLSHTLDIELKVSKVLDSIYNTSLLASEQKGPITK